MRPLTFVYLCRSGENEELRYSIRSVLKYFPTAKIWVVGQKPDWYCGPFIKVAEYPKSKHHAVYQNLKSIANSSDLPEHIIIMNDDFFFTRAVDEIGHYFGGRLLDKVLAYESLFPKSSYTKRLRKAYDYLRNNNFPNPLDYELHVPMKVKRSRLSRAIEHNIPWRSAYGNMFKVKGTKMVDVKVYSNGSSEIGGYDYKLGIYPFLSTDDASFEGVRLNYLMKKFPHPTIYESKKGL
jgi:hypothetical protein